MLPRRDWDYPHLFRFYIAMAALWMPCVIVTGVFAMIFTHGAADRPGFALPWGTRLMMGTLGTLTMVIVPGASVAATVRVFMNEQRWRREGDPRGR